ncbi:MAG: NUDIX hydrolase [Acidobacteria bacterium]|jgi:8-oxo-dGTP pyrophosphatase MutT (NUDIX family)|nr:MAG: NUDIX hydrolase [Acidobacteriota bacterium]PYV88967.1 MAG: NUDIX hydrolase [Acidobacteriota bacterium]
MTNSLVPVKFESMLREISAGGVVLHKQGADWSIAVIEPQKEPAEKASARKSAPKAIFALPKGLVDPGEKPDQTAIREVYEETGITALPITKLGDIKYVYVRSWGDGQRVFKIVSFYLLRYQSGSIDDIAPEMRIEVRRASWIPMNEAAKKLAYRGERDIIRRAQEYLEQHPEA